MEIKKINIWSLAKIVALINIIIGFIFGLIVTSIAIRLRSGTISEELSALEIQPLLPVLKFAFIVYPIYYGVIGFIGSVVFGALYNLLALKVGGIIIETKK